MQPAIDLFGGVRSDGYWEHIATTVLHAAQRCVPAYSSPFSRQDFTQRQLIAALVLRQLLKASYRGVCEFLHAAPGVRDALGLKKVPHFTTLRNFAQSRGIEEIIDALLAQIASDSTPEGCEVAIDSTGIDSSCASRYYRGRTGRHEAKYIKVSVAVVCGSLLPCALVVDWGPSPDTKQAPAVVDKMMACVKPSRALLDKGYDSEALHTLLREGHGVESVIPAVPRRGVIKSKYRTLMRTPPACYGRRWHAETFMSMLKRLTGEGTRSRGPRRPLIEAAFKVLAVAVHR